MITDPLAWVRAEMDAAEKEAVAATQGPWFANEYVQVDDFDASIGTGRDRLREDAVDVVGHGYEGGGVVHLADAVHIARHNPAAVLRRIAADRKQLDLHAAVPDHGRFSEGDCEAAGCDGDHDSAPVCRACRTYAGDPIEAPCPTIEILAQGWGWTSGS